eukprot:Nk52_evm1s654 gene=Nk52_evmTU1s654
MSRQGEHNQRLPAAPVLPARPRRQSILRNMSRWLRNAMDYPESVRSEMKSTMDTFINVALDRRGGVRGELLSNGMDLAVVRPRLHSLTNKVRRLFNEEITADWLEQYQEDSLAENGDGGVGVLPLPSLNTVGLRNKILRSLQNYRRDVLRQVFPDGRFNRRSYVPSRRTRRSRDADEALTNEDAQINFSEEELETLRQFAIRRGFIDSTSSTTPSATPRQRPS